MSNAEPIIVRLSGLPEVIAIGLQTILENGGFKVRCGGEAGMSRHEVLIASSEYLLGHYDLLCSHKGRVIVWAQSGCSETTCELPVIAINDSAVQIVELVENLSQEQGGQTATLTGRETEIIRLIALGRSNKEVAEKLFISINTVATHRKNIARKLGIRSASGLSLYAMMHGLV